VPFPRITYKEAMEKFNCDKPDLRSQLNCEFAFCWVVDFPLFKFNTEEKRWESEHHPFTAPLPEDMEKLETAPDKIRSSSYDLVLNGMELGSGSIRIHRQELQEKIFRVIGLKEDQIRSRFGFLLEAFQFGAPPHGGVAFGLDRLLTILSGESSIREVITFPKNSNAFCPLTSAPSDVEDKQLKELGLTIIKERSLGPQGKGLKGGS
jgi:aspartyl-tRNA synthetase